MTIKFGKYFYLETTLTTLFLRVGKREVWLEKGNSVLDF